MPRLRPSGVPILHGIQLTPLELSVLILAVSLAISRADKESEFRKDWIKLRERLKKAREGVEECEAKNG